MIRSLVSGVGRWRLNGRPLTLLVEQGTSTLWNFGLGALVAKLGGKELFGVYASILAVIFFLTGPLAAATVSIAASDSARLNRSKAAYLNGSALAGSKLAAVIACFACMLVGLLSCRQHVVPPSILFVFGSIFVFSTLVSDVIRRTLLLGDGFRYVSVFSAMRLFLLGVVAVLCIQTEDGISKLLIWSVFVSGVYLVCVAMLLRCGMSCRATRLAFSRQISIGKWGFLSGVVMTLLDQGTLVIIGISGKTDIAGEMRAASYLFGMMSPVLLVLDFYLPSLAMRLTRSGRSKRGVFVLAALGLSAATIVSVLICFVSVRVWIPSLGPSYAGLDSICYLAGFAFICMMSRSFILPVIRIRAPKLLLASSLLGTAAGFGMLILSHQLTAVRVQEALLLSAFTLAMTTFLIAISLQRSARTAIASTFGTQTDSH